MSNNHQCATRHRPAPLLYFKRPDGSAETQASRSPRLCIDSLKTKHAP